MNYKVFECTSFKGLYPVGTSAIVVAGNVQEARKMLSDKLESLGLGQSIFESDLDEIFLDSMSVTILNDGDY